MDGSSGKSQFGIPEDWLTLDVLGPLTGVNWSRFEEMVNEIKPSFEILNIAMEKTLHHAAQFATTNAIDNVCNVLSIPRTQTMSDVILRCLSYSVSQSESEKVDACCVLDCLKTLGRVD